MTTGWWTLKITGVGELTDVDREHIAHLIIEGWTEGEILQDDEETNK